MMDWHRNDYVISTDPERLNLEFIHHFLANTSYWAKGRPLTVVKRAIENSLNFGLYKGADQLGFARVVTDRATFAWLADVFIIEDYRGRGLSKWLLEIIVSHPELQGLRRWVLATKDAHELYRRFGFTQLNDPGRWMEKFGKNVGS